MARKSEVYTWRVSSAMKASLEEAARNTNRSVARLLDEIVAERLDATAAQVMVHDGIVQCRGEGAGSPSHSIRRA